MRELLLAHEPAVRLSAFLAVFVAMAGWEVAAGRRALVVPKARRWLANLSLVVTNTVLLRVVLPMGAVGMAALAAERGWGLLHVLAVPPAVAFVASLVLLDLAIYVQHVLFHAVPLLWRLHVVHHADPDLDVTTGTRFHPIEMVLSMGIKLVVVSLLGAPAAAVVAFEVVLNATATFNHANVRLPGRLDRALRWLVVTPDMHRVHHSVERRERDSNYGFNLPWWDRLFGTYRDQPAGGHVAMTIGVGGLQRERRQSVAWMLLLPFRGGGRASTRSPRGRLVDGPRLAD